MTKKHYLEFTLVLQGDANLGKTQLARSFMSMLAIDMATTSIKPYFIQVNTVDALREASGSQCFKCGVPVIFDDIEPSKACGSRKGHMLEDLKALCDVTNTVSIHARYKDIVLDERQPRIFTTNSTQPSEWHSQLPVDVLEMSANRRKDYNAHVKAIFKRTAFARVTHSLIPEEIRKAFQ
eukprot:5133816-Amphidinium_carterae.1